MRGYQTSANMNFFIMSRMSGAFEFGVSGLVFGVSGLCCRVSVLIGFRFSEFRGEGLGHQTRANMNCFFITSRMSGASRFAPFSAVNRLCEDSWVRG